jgi:predicted dehydrogenase
MRRQQPLKFGMVGAGAIAQAYSQAFTMTDSAHLVAVCDLRREAAEAVASSHAAASFTGHDEMVAKSDLNAVIVCTPPNTHADICMALMQQGVNVLCEKPLALDANSARAMLDCAKKCDVKFTMASKFRYVNDVLRAKAIVTSGILGEIVLFENTFAGHEIALEC